MIVSCSRRTDVPAFFVPWLLRRLAAGFCEVANPFNPQQRSQISLRPEEVDLIVFWSKSPAPLAASLPLLAERGLRWGLLFTLTAYGPPLEPALPPLAERLATFRELARTWGADHLVWRYDPISISPRTDYGWHAERFAELAAALRGSTWRVIVSFVDLYAKTRRNLAPLGPAYRPTPADDQPEQLAALARKMAAAARANGMAIQSCAERLDLAAAGIAPGGCIDAELVSRATGGAVDLAAAGKDPGQRERCRCLRSRDIGANETCAHGCRYCYATTDHQLAARRLAAHDATAAALAPASDRAAP